jgi:cytochrome c-type biogenesis protein CcmH
MIWVLIALLSLLALGLILPPVLRRSAVDGDDGLGVFQGQLAEVRRDLELGLLDESEFRAAELDIRRRAAAASRVSVGTGGIDRIFRSSTILGTGLAGLMAVSIYLTVGSPHLVGAEVPRQAELPPEIQEVVEEIEALAGFMMSNPDNADGWSLLGQAYLSMGRYSEAIVALDNLIRLRPESAEHYALLGQAHLLLANGEMSAAAREATVRALDLDPDEPRARFFAAEARFQDGDIEGAVAAWQALLELQGSEPRYRRMIEARLAAIASATAAD